MSKLLKRMIHSRAKASGSIAQIISRKKRRGNVGGFIQKRSSKTHDIGHRDAGVRTGQLAVGEKKYKKGVDSARTRTFKSAFNLPNTDTKPVELAYLQLLGTPSRLSDKLLLGSLNARDRERAFHPKVIQLGSFLGRVTGCIGERSIVQLMNVDTGSRFEAECQNNILSSKGIVAGDEFRCEVVRDNAGLIRLSFQKVPPKKLTVQQRQTISKRVEERLS